MNNFNLEITNLDYLESSNEFDIIHDVRLVLNEKLISSSKVIVTLDDQKTKIRLNHKEKNEVTKEDFLFIPETQILFYKGYTEWLAFDLNKKVIKRNEHATSMEFFERKSNVVVIYDELYVECTDLNADQIHRVPIDPPTESAEFEDRIEFESPAYGKQILKLKK